MVPLLIFAILMFCGFGLILYSFIDHRNRIYANILALFIAATVFAYLGVLAPTDTVYENTCCCLNETVNQSTDGQWDDTNQTWINGTLYYVDIETCADEHTFNSPSLAYFCYFVSFCCFVYTLYMIWEAWEEFNDAKRQKQEKLL